MGIIGGALYSCYNYFYVILNGGVGKNGSTVAVSSSAGVGQCSLIKYQHVTDCFSKWLCLGHQRAESWFAHWAHHHAGFHHFQEVVRPFI